MFISTINAAISANTLKQLRFELSYELVVQLDAIKRINQLSSRLPTVAAAAQKNFWTNNPQHDRDHLSSKNSRLNSVEVRAAPQLADYNN